MTEHSKSGILEVLSKLSTEELMSLAATVTQGLLRNKISTRAEAIQAIVNYSADEISILRRKLITREILFEYLHDKKVPFSLPITKNEIIDKITIYWKLPKNNNRSGENKQEEDVSQYDYGIQYMNPASSSDNIQYANLPHNTQYANSPLVKTEYASSSNNEDYQVIPKNYVEDENIYLMAQQFSSWFYSMMNQNAPISTEHFYPDATLKLGVVSNGIDNNEVVESDPSEICALLFRTKTLYNIYFNPNVSKEGVQGRMDPHGLVIVLACGTLHVNDVCAGVFEQMFALARDPFADNNWKIKNTQLNLRSQQIVSSTPRLCDNELTSNYLSLPTS